jgi:hypothetical protein
VFREVQEETGLPQSALELLDTYAMRKAIPISLAKTSLCLMRSLPVKILDFFHLNFHDPKL